jgi:hypothetical protein
MDPPNRRDRHRCGGLRGVRRADVGVPYYPVWSLLIIALSIFVIWALAGHGRELVRD